MRGQLLAYQLYTQVDLDSGALMMKCFIAHLLREDGLYHGTVMLGERFVAGFVIEVNETAEETQATVDLSELHFGARGTAPNEVVKRFAVKTGGYVVLHVGQGDGGYHVLLRNTDDDQSRPWNSQRLDDGDIFSAIPLPRLVYAKQRGERTHSRHTSRRHLSRSARKYERPAAANTGLCYLQTTAI